MTYTMKSCSKCGEERSLDQFHNRTLSIDGKTASCKNCTNSRIRANYAKDPETKKAKTRAYHLEHSEWSKVALANWHQKNKQKRLEKVKHRIATEPEFAQYRRQLVAEHERNRRALKANTQVNKITIEDYSQIFTEYSHKCWICESTLDERTVVWDHVRPLARGGTHTVDNLRPACNPCNIRKNALYPFTDEMKTRIATEVRNLQNT